MKNRKKLVSKARPALFIDPRTGLITNYNPRKKGDGSNARLSR